MVAVKNIFLKFAGGNFSRNQRIGIFILCLLFFFSGKGYAQCENTYGNPGNNVLSEARVCAPNHFIWEIKYSVIPSASVQFLVDWGDGNSITVTPTPKGFSGPFIEYVDTVDHVYPRGGNDCNYFPTAFVVVNGQQCMNSDQSQSITVWDVDSENGGQPRINPLEYRVCLGESATVTFKDNSIWNCVPSSGEFDHINNLGRWVQWIYGSGLAANRIPGVEVNGTPQMFSFDGPVEYLPGPIETSNSSSYNVFVPSTTNPSDIGKEFLVQLRNWNICNPYDTNLGDGDPLNPVNPNGDSTFILTTAKIVIVEQSQPDFNTHLQDASGPVKTEFCVGDKVYFKDLTPGISGANFAYEWQIFDDDTGNILAKAANSRNTSYTFSSKGRKMIQLTVRDNNSVGKCGGTMVKFIDIVSTADAKIRVSDENDQPLTDLCFDPVNKKPLQVKFTDISTDVVPATYKWQWDFYHFNGTTFTRDSTQRGTGTQESFLGKYTQAGSYMAILTDSANTVDCFTQDTALVHIYSQPIADFTSQPVCQEDSTTFTSTAYLPAIINNDRIDQYEWDFDYDGVTFNTDLSNPDAGAFQHKFPAAGIYRVAHRVKTAKGTCFADVVVKDVTVKPSPYVSFHADKIAGCSPLQVTFTVDTLLVNQPTTVASYLWHIKDSKTNSIQDITLNPPADTLMAPDFVNTQSSLTDHQYKVWLEAIAANTCNIISDTVTITVYPEPTADFVITNLSGGDTNCSPRNYTFQVTAATQALHPDSYQWTITNEADSSVVAEISLPGTNPDFAYTLFNDSTISKKYKVSLQAERSGLCFKGTERIVTVNPLPSSAFEVTLVSADCQSAIYHAEAEQKGLAYQWAVDPLPLNNPDFSQDQFELVYDKQPNDAYEVNINLKTTNFISCESKETTKKVAIEPQEAIEPSFFVNPSILEIPNRTVTISNNTNPGNWTYLWEFGDGTTSTSSNPGTHTYETYGEYWIKLSVTGAYCHEQDSAKVIIKQSLPILDFDYSQIEGCLPLTVNFHNASQYADETTYVWDFGDGHTSTAINPSYTYKNSGIYTITLKASNSLGTEVKKQKDLIIDLSQGPQADFTIRLAKSYLPDQDIFFSNQSQRATIFYWDFGDGATSNQKDPVHAYGASGHYNVSLIVQNELGCTDTLAKPIFIEPLVPEVDFTYEPPTGCRPLTVQFRNLSRYAEPGSYRWSFGEGQGVSTEENPGYTYYEPGIYTVTLEASNSIGVTATEKKEFSVEVYDNPIAAFNLRPDKAFLSEDIYFVNLSMGSIHYFWDFGDGNTSTDFEPVHRYEAPGTYDISLIAENEHGCADTLKKASAVIVEAGGKIQVPNAFTPSTFGPGGTDANGAGKNDVFLPVYEGVTSFHMMIYNRWGELLFESFDKGYGWDGYYKGKLCAKDVYVYKLELKFSDGKSNTLVGDVTLVR